MDESKAKELLEEWFNGIYRQDYGKKARATYAKLKVFSDSRTVSTERNLYEQARMVLKARGDFVEAEQDRKLVLAMVSGRHMTNPTIVELLFEEGQLHISAWAKEGWIPQKSAPKAIELCLEDLKRN